MTPFAATVCIIAIFMFLWIRHLQRANQRLLKTNRLAQEATQRLQTENTRLTALTIPPPRKSVEEQQSEWLDKQMEAVCRDEVTFYKHRVMGRGERDMFYAALNVIQQPLPSGPYPFYVFPQVSLGQIIGAKAPRSWLANQAHQAINSKRCDLLLSDRQGNPVAVLEYQGEGHNIGGTAARRDEIKRIALEGAGVRFIEIRAGASQAEIRRTVERVFDQHISAGRSTK